MSRVLEYAAGQPWAITPEALDQILAIASRAHERPEAIQTRSGRPLDNTRRVRIRDGVAVIPVVGPLFRYANLFTEISGATSSEVLAQDLATALDDAAVEAILLDIDSPGGMLNGTQELGELIYAARGRKPIVAFVSGLGASAAYWIASAADEVVAGETAILGSIGTVLEVVDTSAADEKRGVRRMEIVSSQSPRKRGNPFEDDEARAALQAMVDDLSRVFITAVARNRGVDRETVLADFGRGGMMVGEEAVRAGLADRLSTLEDEIVRLARGAAPMFGPAAGGDSTHSLHPEDPMSEQTTPATTQGPEIDRAYLDAKHPNLVAAIRSEAATEAATAERERILAILDLPAQGVEDLRTECVEDPEVSRGEAALRILHAQAQRSAQRKQAYLDAREADEELGAPAPGTETVAEDDDRVKAKRVVALHRQLKGRGDTAVTA